MKVLISERTADRTIASTVQRRWRWAALAGLVIFLALAGYALAVTGARNAGSVPVAVLVAASDIRPGTTITGDLLRSTTITPQDPALLTTLVKASGQETLLGQVAQVGVPAGSLIPAEIVSSQVHGQLWVGTVPVKRMPVGLAPGDHVALLASAPNRAGQSVDFVFMQDIEVAHVAGSQVDLWLPAKVVAQVEWYADNGGLVLLSMQSGAIQQDLPAASGS